MTTSTNDCVRERSIVERLYSVPNNAKAEIVDGKVVMMSPTGGKPGRAATNMVVGLGIHRKTYGGGSPCSDNVGFLVNLPNRGSFSPDAAWSARVAADDDMDFIEGEPDFAVEVRSKGDVGPKSERAIARTIQDSFAAGTDVVRDVDLILSDTIGMHRTGILGMVATFRRGDVAIAEPAVPGWRMPAHQLFE